VSDSALRSTLEAKGMPHECDCLSSIIGTSEKKCYACYCIQ
jgi:hypothetical protein